MGSISWAMIPDTVKTWLVDGRITYGDVKQKE